MYTSVALFAFSHDWTIPTVQDTGIIEIHWWRHPVVEAYLPSDEQFIPNGLLQTDTNFFHLITWPNMGWKSTYMRQNALIILLAHAWLPVPAQSASVCLVDWMYARIWTGDIIAKNQSTFLTEMVETAFILHHATNRSFIVIDELGRGTSTDDWLALAKSIIVYMCQQIKAKTLFATHFHQLIDLEWSIAWVENWHVWVFEWSNEIVFLKKIIRWWTDKSYWLRVAKLAWMPFQVIEWAVQYSGKNESDSAWSYYQQQLFTPPSAHDTLVDELVHRYAWIDISSITPIQALLHLESIINLIQSSQKL
jgi:DNA mismatch repair protein MutS